MTPNHCFSTRRLLIATTAIGLLQAGGFVTQALANEIVWSTATNGNWSDAAKWTGSIPPQTNGTDSVTFTTAVSTAYTSTIDSAWSTAGTVLGIKMSGTNGATLNILPGTSVTSLSVGSSGISIAGGNGSTTFNINAIGTAVSNFELNAAASQTWSTSTGAIQVGFSGVGSGSRVTKLTSGAGVVIKKTGGNYLTLGWLDTSGFNGSFELSGGFIKLGTSTAYFNALGSNALTVNGGNTDTLQFQFHANDYVGGIATGTFANNVVFGSSFLSAVKNVFAIPAGINAGTSTGFTLNFTGNWSGDVGASDPRNATYGFKDAGISPTNSAGGIILGHLNSGSLGDSLIKNRYVFKGDNSGLTSSTSDNSQDKFPITLASGVILVVDNAHALGSNNSLLVRLRADRETSGVSGYQSAIGLLATNGLTVNSDIRIGSNYQSTNTDGSLVPMYLGSDIAGANVVFNGNVYLESHDQATRVPLLRLLAVTGGVSTFNGSIQEYSTAHYPSGANHVTVSVFGGGKVVLSGNNSYVGETAVTNNSILQVDGSLAGTSGVLVNAGSTLQGTGSIANGVTVAGNLNPGNSIGILTVGSVVFNSGGKLNIELGTDASSDKLVVANVLDITNANLVLTGNGGGPIYVIATYGSLVGSQFSSISGLPEGYSIDYGTGQNGTITMKLIPEPASLAIAGIGGGLMFIRRKK